MSTHDPRSGSLREAAESSAAMRAIVIVVGVGIVTLAIVLALATLGASLARADYGANVPIPFRLLPADNPWNTPVAALPVDTDSDHYLRAIGPDDECHPDFGTVWEGAPIGIPYVVVPGDQPGVRIDFIEYGEESDPGPYPIPADAPVEGAGGWLDDGDRHVLVLDADHQMLYELYHARFQGDHWDAGSGAVFDLRSNALRPDGWTSADAAGLPILPGLVRYDEVVGEGVIDHALRFTVERSQQAYLYPATHFASDDTDPDLPPMGLRLRLKADFDVSGFPQEIRVVLQALKTYGMIVADNGADMYIGGSPDPRWDDEALHTLHQVHTSDFEVVDSNGLRPGWFVVAAGAEASLREGQTLTRTGSFADDGDGPWSASVDYGEGAAAQPLALAGDKTFALAHRYADDGTRTVRVVVTGGGGASGTAQFVCAVRNAPPRVRAGRDETVRRSAPFARRGSFSDPGADVWRARVAWGDGSGRQILRLGTDRSFSLRHVFRHRGVFTVSVTVLDDDGGRGVDRLRVTAR